MEPWDRAPEFPRSRKAPRTGPVFMFRVEPRPCPTAVFDGKSRTQIPTERLSKIIVPDFIWYLCRRKTRELNATRYSASLHFVVHVADA